MTGALLLPLLLTLLLPRLCSQDPEFKPAAPPHVEWQRSLADALAVQQATGRPLLLCVNMDGERFCELFAGTTYRDPAFVATTRGYVCLVASPDRHNDRDYDGQGRRVECPRFPGCTCSEHINVEPLLFERWFKGQRAAPRHVGVAKDGTILFDRFLDGSMDTAIAAVTKNAAAVADEPLPATVAALLGRRDAAARRGLEARWLAADATSRATLLEAAAQAKNEPFDLLRLGLRDDREPVFGAAALALAATATKDALIDLEDALARADDAATAKAIEAAIDRLAAGDPASRQFLAHLRAVRAATAAAAKEPYFASMANVTVQTLEERDTAEQALDRAEAAAKAAPKDPAALGALALATLQLALLLPAGDKSLPLLLDDSRRAAGRALAVAADDGQRRTAHAVQTIASWQLGDRAAARQHADAALAFATGRSFDASPLWFAALLRAAAGAAAADAYDKAQQDATADVADDLRGAALAFELLLNHAAFEPADVQHAAALLAFAGARAEAQALLADGVARFPDSRELHLEFRNRIVADRGAEALRARYAALVAGAADRATAEWFAGYAAIVAAELHVKDHRRELAQQAYGECIERTARAAQNGDYADSANHFAVLAHAGRALLRHEAGDADGTVADLLAAIKLRPASMGESDGLGRKPEAILRRIAEDLRQHGKDELADRLQKAQ